MNTGKQPSISSGRHGGPRPGSGRPKGSLDKGNALIRDLIVQSLDKLGGVAYLEQVAKTHPAAFMSLLGRVIPVQLTGEGGGPIQTGVTLTVTGVQPQG